MALINLSDVNVPEAGSAVGSLVHVIGGTRLPSESVEMVGFLSGVTFTNNSIIVYMEHGQSTTFRLSNEVDVTMEILPNPS